jgi:hypothetical protein
MANTVFNPSKYMCTPEAARMHDSKRLFRDMLTVYGKHINEEDMDKIFIDPSDGVMKIPPACICPERILDEEHEGGYKSGDAFDNVETANVIRRMVEEGYATPYKVHITSGKYTGKFVWTLTQTWDQYAKVWPNAHDKICGNVEEISEILDK